MKTKSSKAVVIMALTASHFSGVSALQVAETPPAKATVEGVLVAKGSHWIEVKADGTESAVRYRPRWIGKMPKDGGGLDAVVLKSFGKLLVPGRVRLNWENLEGPRVLAVEMLTPAEKSGRLNGIVTAKGEKWLEIRVGDKVERYSPRWIGGLPKNGGGLEKAILEAIAATKIGDPVVFEWVFEERKRVTLLRAPV